MYLLVHFIQSSSNDIKFYPNDTRFIISGNFRSDFWNRATSRYSGSYFFSIGLVAKLLYESIESIDPGPLEAMTAVGANKVKWIVYGVIPQVKAHFVSYVLYTFEVNIRAAAVLGLVGAGGIGLYYDRTLDFTISANCIYYYLYPCCCIVN